VRYLGGVSLFEINDINLKLNEKSQPGYNWSSFIPVQPRFGSAIWIEIDRDHIAEKFISAPMLIARWKNENALGHRILANIEAAHIGPIPVTTFKRVFSVSKGDNQIREIKI